MEHCLGCRAFLPLTEAVDASNQGTDSDDLNLLHGFTEDLSGWLMH